jgi:hypothetical protein
VGVNTYTNATIGHYYLGPAGSLSHNLVGVKGLAMPDRRYGRGETFATIGPDGTTAYTHRITESGGLDIADGTGRSGRCRAPASPMAPRSLVPTPTHDGSPSTTT